MFLSRLPIDWRLRDMGAFGCVGGAFGDWRRQSAIVLEDMFDHFFLTLFAVLLFLWRITSGSARLLDFCFVVQRNLSPCQP